MFLQTLSAQSQDLWFALEKKSGRGVYASENFRAKLGYEPVELLRHSWQQWVHPQDLPGVAAFWAEEPWRHPASQPRLELRLRHRNGSYLWFEATLTLIPKELGNGPYLVGQLRDISAQMSRRQTHDEALVNLRTLYRSSQQLILLIGEDHRVLSISEQAQSYYHRLFSRQVGIGDSMLELIAPSHLASFQANFRRALQGESIQVEGELSLPEKTFYFAFHYLPVVEENGRIHRVFLTVWDRTEQQEAENALRENEFRFRRAIQGSQVQVWEQDLQLRYVWIYNPHPKVQPEEVIGKMDRDFFPPEQAAHLTQLKRAVLDSGVLAEEEVQVTVEGKTYYHELVIEPKKDEAGNLVGIICLDVDITARKQVELALKQSEERLFKANTVFREAEKTATLGSFELDLNTSRWYVSEGWKQIHGLAQDALDFEELRSLIHPEDLARVWEALKTTMAGHKPYKVEHRIIRRSDQAVRYVSVHARFIRDPQGKPVRMYGSVSDITEQQEVQLALASSEERYRKLIDLMDEGVVLFGPDGQVKAFNHAAQSIYELTPEEFAAPDPNRFQYTREDGSPMPLSNHPGWITLQEGRAVQNVIMGLKLKDKLKWVKKSSIPLQLGNDLRPHALVTVDDITSLKEKEAKLREANATKDRFFSIISHDLRSPLNAIFGLTEILEAEVREKGDAELARMIGLLKHASGQAIDLLVNLLEWSRAQSGRLSFEPAPGQLLSLVMETQKLLEGSLQEKNLHFSVEVPETLWVEADKNMVRTILRNLVSNAVKFTPSGGKINLTAWLENDAVYCAVTDTGIGIKKRDLPKLFRQDQHVSSLGTRKEKGTGLGLILCHDFIERHGGTLTVESEPQKGATFTFSLPLAPAPV